MAEPTTADWKTQSMEILRPLLPKRWRSDIPLVPVVRLIGTIGFTTPLRPGMTLAAHARSLERAFTMRNARAVALLINSPGGSAAQSHLIYKRIRQLAEENDKPVFAFVEDVAASGGYMIACAADEIVCDPSSVVGSIGVVGGSFGFAGLMEKLGVERRLYTSGEHKAMLDPFLPEKPDDVARIKAIQHDIHAMFIALVKERRDPKLKGEDDALFSGEYWTGSKALELGLVDGNGDLRGTLRERYGDKVLTPLISAERGFFGRRIPGFGSSAINDLLRRWGSEGSGPGFADELISTLETRALWARYGL